MENRTVETGSLMYARIAGIMYVVIIVIGLLHAALIDAELIVPADEATSAVTSVANSVFFRVGIAATLVMYASVVVLSWSLYVLLKAVNRNLALLAMLLRLGEAILGAATVLVSLIVLHLVSGEESLAAFEAGQLQALVAVFLHVRTAGLDIVLVFVGLGGTLFCYLFFTSKYVPRVLAAWGMFTYVSMLVVALMSILFPDHPVIIESVLYSLGAGFELVMGFWLLIKGVKLEGRYESNGIQAQE